MWSSATRKMPTIKRGAHTPKNTLEIMGTMAQVAAQGTAQAKAMVRMRWPQLSMTRVPAAPPMVQPKLTRKGMMALPCKTQRSTVKHIGDAGHIADFFDKAKHQRDAKDKANHGDGKIQRVDAHITDETDDELRCADGGESRREPRRQQGGEHTAYDHKGSCRNKGGD